MAARSLNRLNRDEDGPHTQGRRNQRLTQVSMVPELPVPCCPMLVTPCLIIPSGRSPGLHITTRRSRGGLAYSVVPDETYGEPFGRRGLKPRPVRLATLLSDRRFRSLIKARQNLLFYFKTKCGKKGV